MNHPPSDPELIAALAKFVGAFEQVFHDDWRYSRANVADSYFIAKDGTFLEPRVEDEVENWGYRAMLLKRYRHLKALMDAANIHSVRNPVPSDIG